MDISTHSLQTATSRPFLSKEMIMASTGADMAIDLSLTSTVDEESSAHDILPVSTRDYLSALSGDTVSSSNSMERNLLVIILCLFSGCIHQDWCGK